MARQSDQCSDVEIDCQRNSQDEETDGLLSDFILWRRPQGRRWLSYILAFLLGLSLFINIVTLILSQTRDIDTLCSLYTSESGKCTYRTAQFIFLGMYLNLYAEALL